VFRIVRGGPLGEADFETHYEAKTALSAPPCGRAGISVFHSLEKAAHRQRLTPRLGSAISEGTLEPDAGKTLLTSPKSGHIEWWPYKDIVRASYFSEGKPCNT
jgi:hypothetical protein